MITKEDVRDGYLWILGREPESQAVINAHAQAYKSREDFRLTLFRSQEFGQKLLSLGVPMVTDSRWVMVPTKHNLSLWVNLRDQFVSRGCLMGDYEPSESRAIAAILRPGDTFVDVGANIGWHSLIASRLVGEGGRVYSFEPNPEIFHYLNRSVKDSGITNLTAFRTGLADKPSEARLVVALDGLNPGGGHLDWAASTSEVNSYGITLARLDDILPEVKSCRLIKMDIEGAEPLCLLGATEFIKRHRPIILSEILPHQIQKVSGHSVADYHHILDRMGYRAFKLEGFDPNRLEPADWDKIAGSDIPVNILLYHSSHRPN